MGYFVKDNGDVEFFDLFDPKQPRSEEELKEYRMSICKQCPFFIGGRCKKCGCFMSLKSTLAKAKCPIGKW
jgi:hypothetical protein